MDISISWVPIFAATAATFTSGALWYSVFFRDSWMKHAKVNKSDTEKGSVAIFLIPLAVSFIVAFSIYHIAFVTQAYFGGSFLVNALQVSLWTWLSFSFASLAMNYVFQGQPKQLLAIDAGNLFVMFLISGAIIGFMVN